MLITSSFANILRNAPRGYLAAYDAGLNGHLARASAIEHALGSVASPRTDESIRQLIALLRVDLSRFDTGDDRDRWRCAVASHLIELTGESFGVDADSWLKWFRERAGFAIPGAGRKGSSCLSSPHRHASAFPTNYAPKTP